MNIENVECQICKQEMSFGRIKRHVESRHKEISLEDYLKLYWNTLPLHKPCEVCKENIVYKYKTCSKECRSKLEHSHKGKPKPPNFITEERKKILSNMLLGKPGLFTGYKHSEETKLKSSQRMKGEKIHLGYKQSDYQKQKASDNMKKYYAAGNEPWTKNNKHSIETIEKIFKKRKINNLEQIVFDLLIQHNIGFKFQFFLNDGVNCKSYDFKINGYKILLEIDGDFWHGNPNTKHHFKYVEETKNNDLFKEQLAKQKGYKLLRFWESDVKKDPMIIINSIKNNI